MSILWTNNAASVLTGDITAGTLSISVTAGQGDRFPAVASPHYFMATLVDTSGNREIVKVTARTSGSNTMTIERAQEGTSARSFATGDIVELRITKNAMDHLSKAADINAQHYVCDASAADQGAATNSSSLKSLVDALGATEEATIDLPHTGTGDTTTYTVGTNLTIPATVTLRVHKGARVSPSGGVTLTVNGIIQAGAYTIFAGAGTVTVSTYPQDQAWWGNAQRMDGNFLVQSYDTDLATFSLPANTTISAFIKTLLDDADAATARATLGVENIGTSAPSEPSGLMWWADTANNLLKLRNAANNAWLEIYDFGNDRVGTGKVKTDSLDSGAVTDVKVTSVGGSKITAGSIPSGKFQAGAIAGADIADGTITRAKIGAYTAGNYFIIGSDSEKTTAATSYTKVKEIVVTRTGTLRVSFALAAGSGGINAYGRVYRNGVAVGTARNTTSATPQTYSEDISGWEPNDLCQIYAYTQSGSYPAKVTNFRLYTGAPEREYVTLD